MPDVYHYDEETGEAINLFGSVPIDDTQASENTVYSSAKVEELIENENAIMTQSLSNTNFYVDWAIVKTGNEVMILIYGFKNLTNVQTNDLGVVIPEAYRPKRDVVKSLVSSSSSTTYEAYRLKILTNGKITVYPYNGLASQNNIQDTLTYIIG